MIYFPQFPPVELLLAHSKNAKNMSTWDDLRPHFKRLCLSSLLSERTEALTAVRTKLPHDDVPVVLPILLSSYNYYLDPKSRNELVAALDAIVAIDGKYVNAIVKYIAHVPKQQLAITSYLTLLHWINHYLPVVDDSAVVAVAVSAQSEIVDHALDQCTTSTHKHLQRITTSVKHSSQMAMVKLASRNPELLAVQVKGDAGAIACHYGLLAAVEPGIVSPELVSKALAWYGSDVLLAKSAPATSSLQLFGEFVAAHVDANMFLEVLPSAEKAVLRSSELTWGTTLPILFAACNFDLSVVVKSKLLSSMLTAIKSPKAHVATGAVAAATTVVAHTIAEQPKLIDEIIKALKGTSNVDAKRMVGELLTKINTTDGASVVDALIPLAAKDVNEVSLAPLADSICRLAPADAKYTQVIVGGLQDKKPPVKRVWYNAVPKASPELVATLSQPLAQAVAEISAAPLPAITNKSIGAGYIGMNYADKIDDVTVRALVTDDKVYTKLESDDLHQYLPVLVRSAPVADHQTYAEAWVYVLTGTDYAIKLAALKQLGAIASANEWLGEEILNVITTNLIAGVEIESKSIPPILACLTQLEDETLSQRHALKSVVITCHDNVPVNNGWIGLLQRSHGATDVAKLTLENFESLTTEYTTQLFTATGEWHKALVKALGLLSFILPEPVVPTLLGKLSENYSPAVAQIAHFEPQTLAIWKHNAEQPYVDVLSAKNTDKGGKDYETRKWEEEMKKDLKKKVVLTKDQQKLVKDQLEKEAEVRADVDQARKTVASVLAVFSELAATAKLGVDNGTGFWFADAVAKITRVVGKQETVVFTVVGDVAVECWLKLSEMLTPKLASSRTMIGVASLRAIGGDSRVESRFTAEPLVQVIGRLLYRIKMVSDSSPLDSVTWTYILPLLVYVLDQGHRQALSSAANPVVNREFEDEDPVDEQLLLALDLVSNHAEMFAGSAHRGVSSRAAILKVVVSLLKVPQRAKVAKETLTSIGHYIGIAPSNEDLAVLLQNTIVPEGYVKSSVLEVIDSEFDLHAEGMVWSPEIWIAVHDEDEVVSELAATIWQESQFTLPVEGGLAALVAFFGNENTGIRRSVARAFVQAAVGLNQVDTAVDVVLDHYRARKDPPPPETDEFGLVINSRSVTKDPWEDRSAVALVLDFVSAHIQDGSIITKIIKFMVTDAALGDRNDDVRQEMQVAAVHLISQPATASKVGEITPIIDECLALQDSGNYDRLKESAIVCLGAAGQHLSGSHLDSVIDQMLSALSIPSEDCQVAIGRGLVPLVVKMDDAKFGGYMNQLVDQLLDDTKSIAIRRGSAYGIAGLVKGSGIKSLGDYDVVRSLIEASDDKKNPNRRESAGFAFECLSNALGKFFEPYVIVDVLPVLFSLLGDQVPEVRAAANDAAKEIMKNTTSYGVKKLIPVAIRNLDELAWRTKKGAVELLGNMAYLDPAQLSASLSTIIPEIVGVVNDSHKEVRKAADSSLAKFGEVIRNPEIQQIVPQLISAIGDPTKHTESALDSIMATQFIHYIDGPSLALIIHVVHRGMRDRSAAVKKKACQIVGNMAILVAATDLEPYLSSVVQELEVAMVDPVPATRSTAARALGSLVEKLGEVKFPTLIASLFAALNDPNRAGDRLGSAQALAEVVCGLGTSKLEELLPTMLSGASSAKSAVRAGFMPLLLYLPVCFGSSFAPYLNQIIPPILMGLADTDSEISDTALRAGRLIVHNYAKKAVDLLLPELERGLGDANHRIRLSSLQLTGDLLFQIAGISGKIAVEGEEEEEEEDATNSAQVTQLLIDSLGLERRNHVFAKLFICRSDTAGVVRAAAIDIWNALIGNTPKTVKQVLPVLVADIVSLLASEDDVHRKIAATCLGDTVRRVGSNALAEILPTLQRLLADPTADADAKQGVCFATAELVHSASDDALRQYQSVFVAVVRDAVMDSSASVRAAAADAFAALEDAAGNSVVDDIVPPLLKEMAGPEPATAVAALQQLMSAQAEVIFPILLPTLLAPPLDNVKAEALAQLSTAAGSALTRRLSPIVSALVAAIISDPSNDSVTSALDAVLAAAEDDATHPLMQQLLQLTKHEDVAVRATIYPRLATFFAATSINYSAYLSELVSQFVLSLGDRDDAVVAGTVAALSALVKAQPKENLDRLVKPAAEALEMSGVRDTDLAGFCLPKGPQPVVQIFSHGLMYGNSDLKEISAKAIGDVVSKTPAATLKPVATAITGPLIRVIGEKVGAPVKSAILGALNQLLIKIPQFLRPFVPQLQRTFVRSLSDVTSNELRTRAVKCLATLVGFQPRVDALVQELVTGAASPDSGVKTAMLSALLAVVTKAGANMSAGAKTSVLQLVEQEIGGGDDAVTAAYAQLMGAVAEVVSADDASEILHSKVLDTANNGLDKFGVLTINSFLRYAPAHIFSNPQLLDAISDYCCAAVNATDAIISENGAVAIGKLLLGGNLDSEQEAKVIEALSVAAVAPPSTSASARRLSLVVIRTVARKKHEMISRYLDVVVPSVFLSVRERVIPIKLAGEKAFLAVFNMVEDESATLFNQWFEGKDKIVSVTGEDIIPRSIGDYSKRVATRLAAAEREKIAAGGDAEEMFSDQFEDEKEVWQVGV